MKIIRSNRKSIGLEIKNGEVTVRAPHHVPRGQIDAFVAQHQAWIDKHLSQSKEQMAKAQQAGRLSMEEIRALAEKALKVIPERVAFYASKIGVSYGRISIRNQRSKWGSCSSKGNLNFNCLLMLAPPEVLDSVVVHELCHLKEMNHSKAFYEEIYRVFPNYDLHNRWLKEHGGELMARMLG